MGAAAAQIAGERFFDLAIGRLRVFVEQNFGAHDHAIDAVTALSRLLVHEGFLYRVHFFVEPRPSSVVTARLRAAFMGVTQERIALPSMMTVQAPHWASPQPNFGPFNCRSLRRT